MNRIFLLSVLLFFIVFTVSAQQPVIIRKDSVVNNPRKIIDTTKAGRIDTLKKPAYVNLGKIAGRKAIISSLIFPGLGQIRNGVTVYRLVKVAAIYTGATMLTLSFIDNNKQYHLFLDELVYRQNHNGDPNLEGPLALYAQVDQQGLITAKDTYKRNKEVVIFSLVGLYLVSAIEAYVDARLKYFDVDDIGMKISPSIINTNAMYGFNQVTPGIKLTLKF